MTRRKYWVKKILPFLTCAGLLLTSPVFAEVGNTGRAQCLSGGV